MSSLIPTEPTEPREALEDYTIFLYGTPKIGKSTFASKFNKPLFLATEAGLKSLRVHQIEIKDEILEENGKKRKRLAWAKFLDTLTELAISKHPYKTIVIDTVDNLAEYCANYIYAREGIQYASDLDWGKGWKLLASEAKRGINLLMGLSPGKIFISHSEEKEIKSKRGDVYTKVTHTCPKNFKHMLQALADIILFATMENGRRVLKTKETEEYVAGDRTGRLPDTLPLDYEAFVEAFYSPNAKPKTSKKAGKAELIDKLIKAEAWLGERKIDNFEVEKRVVNSREKHTGAKDLNKASITKLETYYQHLREKANKPKEVKSDNVPQD